MRAHTQEPPQTGATMTMDKRKADLMLRETKTVRFQNQRNWSRMQVFVCVCVDS